MVLPEGTRESESSRPKTLIAVGAALVVLGATIALGLATAPDTVTTQESTTTTMDDEPLHEPTTTTSIDIETFSVSDIATGERLSWRGAPGLDAVWPIELLEHSGRLYLFTSDRQSHPGHLASGLQVWVSSDGIGWERVAEVPEAAVTSIAATGGRLVAMGTHIEDNSPYAWISTDGIDWRASRLPMNVETDFPITTWLTGATLAGDQLIITGSGSTSTQGLIVDRLPPEVADFAGAHGSGLSEGPEGRSIEIYGPLGIIVYSATMEDLGIDKETADMLFEGPGQEIALVWKSVDGVEWTVNETGGPHVERLWPGSGGQFFASGWDNTGPAVWSSTDAITWHRVNRGPVTVIDSWGPWLLGTRNDRDVVRSRDGQEWESVGTDVALPQSLDWYLRPVSLGPGGIAAVATTWIPQEDSVPEPTSLEIGGHTLTIDQNTGHLIVQGDSGRSVIPLWSGGSSEHIKADFVNQRITFVDVETGAELLTVGFETLQEFEMSLYGQVDFEHRALLLNRGDGGWSIFDLAEEIGSEQGVVMIRILEDRMILVTNTIRAWWTGTPTTWSIKVATLP